MIARIKNLFKKEPIIRYVDQETFAEYSAIKESGDYLRYKCFSKITRDDLDREVIFKCGEAWIRLEIHCIVRDEEGVFVTME